MPRYKTKKEKRMRRHMRIRKKIAGTAERPRLCVSITANNIYVQVIDDDKGQTICATSTLDAAFKDANGKANVEGASKLGSMIAEKAKAAGVETCVFDRSGFKFHGRVKAIADAAVENGLKI